MDRGCGTFDHDQCLDELRALVARQQPIGTGLGMDHHDDRSELVDQRHQSVAVERLCSLWLLHERHLRGKELIEVLIPRQAGTDPLRMQARLRATDYISPAQ
jgi:hypothetical protein